jgi:hypothetical protein
MCSHLWTARQWKMFTWGKIVWLFPFAAITTTANRGSLRRHAGRRRPWIIDAVREDAASGRRHGSSLSRVEAQAVFVMCLGTQLVGQHHRWSWIRRAGSRPAQAFTGKRKKTDVAAGAAAWQRATPRSHSMAAHPPTGGRVRRCEGLRQCRHLFCLDSLRHFTRASLC